MLNLFLRFVRTLKKRKILKKNVRTSFNRDSSVELDESVLSDSNKPRR